jgi:hypothetical protein
MVVSLRGRQYLLTRKQPEGTKMSDKTATKKHEETTDDLPVASGELVKHNPNAGGIAPNAVLSKLGLKPADLEGFEQTSSGEITKWFDLRQMMEDPKVSDKSPAKAKPNSFFGGVLMGVSEMKVDEGESGAEEITDEETGEVRTVRYFYFLRLTTPCPVTWKDDEGKEHSGTANPGDIIAVGERFAFKKWRQLVADGSYYVIVQPTARRPLRKNPKRLMWNFNVWEKCLKLHPKLRVQSA